MGLIRAAAGAAGGVLADQWKEYFYCESIPADVLAVKGQKRVSGRSSNTKGSDNIISNGSVIAIADGQCMLIVEQGKVVDVCAEPGEYTYDMSTEPSIFAGDLGESIKGVFQNIGKRFTFGGEAPKDQRVYYFNTKELTGNKYGTPSPVPFRVVDQRAGIDIDIGIRCFGEYSIRLKNPLLFYTNVCGNVSEDYKVENIAGQMKTELLTALQPAFAKISDMGIRYSALPGHTLELSEALNEQLSSKWRDLRGMEIVSFGVSSVKANEEDEQMIKELQRNAAFMDPTRAAAHLVGAQGEAMKAAAVNTGAGPAMAFMGMNMAGQAGGMNAQSLFQMGQQQQMQQQQMQMQQQQMQQAQPAPAPAAQGWTCSCGQSGITGNFCPNCGGKKPEPKPAGDSWQCTCGATVTGKFCPECGSPRPAPADDGWTCTCGAVNKGKFCSECGAKKPAGVPQYKCDKCGWEPADPQHPPKFCPECGDPFDNGDIV
ncbi:MAG: SPFH domain-containing protein [Oscillospiraceae bacterium]|nr:SPFH domain-containing protein [Oscillospiraceae bacterium]